MLFVLSCEPLSFNHKNGESRFFRQAPNALSYNRDSSASSVGDSYYYTAVSFPPDYDWRRDTSFGAVQACINLYRNDSLLMQIPTGALANSDADMHHFVKGHLYTQFRSGGRTVLARDGEPVLELEQEAILAGILPSGGKLYTLWRHRGGEGFSLMDGSSTLFSRSRGQPSGSLNISAYLPSGALYEDMGEPCFCYRNGSDWYVVRGSQETSVRKPYRDVFDIRSIDGHVCIFYLGDSSMSSCLQYKDSVINFSLQQFRYSRTGYIYTNEGEPFCSGAGYQGWETEIPYTIVNFLSGQGVALPGSGLSLISSRPLALLFYSPDGRTGYYSQSSGIKYLEGSYYHLSPSEGIRVNGKLHLALNPMEQGRKPFIWKDGEIQELDLNGYISGIYQSSQ